jgi:hypothetical protein
VAAADGWADAAGAVGDEVAVLPPHAAASSEDTVIATMTRPDLMRPTLIAFLLLCRGLTRCAWGQMR